MEIQFTVAINKNNKNKSADPSQSSLSSAPSRGGRGGTHRFALDTRTRHTRRSSTRARTGCGTCKKRHVKCDETRPACLNCIKWRGYCDAYADTTNADTTTTSSQSSSSTPSNAKLIHTKKAPLILTEPAVNTIRFASDDQRLYFDEWSTLSVNFLGGVLNQTHLWTATMPQVTLEESPLRYGAMAVGALRKAYELEGPVAEPTTSNRHYLNAIAYYCEALRMQAKAKPTREGLRTALLSSLLFICFETQRGNTPAALKHITHGFSMLNELANCTDKAPGLVRIAPAPPALVQDILDCYKPLELQSRSYMGSFKRFFVPPKPGGEVPQQQQPQPSPRHLASPTTSSPSSPGQSPPGQPGTPRQASSPQSGSRITGLPSPPSQGSPQSQGGQSPPQAPPGKPPGIAPFTKNSPYFRPKLMTITKLEDMPVSFRSWEEMYGYWVLVQRQMVQHLPMINMMSSRLALRKVTSDAELEMKLTSINKNPAISKFIAESRYWLQRWSEASQPLYLPAISQTNNQRLLLQAMSIRIDYLILYIYTTVPRFSSLVTVKGLTPQYREINILTERLLQSRPNCGFSMDAGWTWPLFVAAMGCRDPVVRAESIRILGQYPMRNALRDSRVFRAIALKNEETEVVNMAEAGDNQNQQWLQIRRRELVFEKFGTSIIFRSAHKDPDTGEWGLIEEVADANVGPHGQLVWQRQPVSDSESMLAGMI